MDEVTEITEVDIASRYHPRVETGIMVKIVRDGRVSLAKAKDLSMAGLYLVGLRAREDDQIAITVPLPGDCEVTTFCRVRRVHKHGAAVVFEDLDWDDMLALARFLHPRLP